MPNDQFSTLGIPNQMHVNHTEATIPSAVQYSITKAPMERICYLARLSQQRDMTI